MKIDPSFYFFRSYFDKKLCLGSQCYSMIQPNDLYLLMKYISKSK